LVGVGKGKNKTPAVAGLGENPVKSKILKGARDCPFYNFWQRRKEMASLRSFEKRVVKEYLANGGKRQRVMMYDFVPNGDGTYSKRRAGSRVENNLELYYRLTHEINQ